MFHLTDKNQLKNRQMKRYFEFKDDKSQKFWEIELIENSFTVRFGKIGSEGQTSEKEFDTVDKADKEANKLIAEKTKKGYIETNIFACSSDKTKDSGNSIANKSDTGIFQSPNKTIQEIEHILRTKYPIGYGFRFLGRNANEYMRESFSIHDFKAKIGLELPESFYQFYEWLLKVEFTEKNVDNEIYLDSHQNEVSSLKSILDETKMWQEIQTKNPKREWKSGFVALLSYNDAYQMIIDTKGEINEIPGCIAVWDFKGGSWYRIEYIDFDDFLKTKLELLKENLYFPPSLETNDIDDPNGELITYDDFMYGETANTIKSVIEKINGKPYLMNL
jgi:predicted DNA-binding WGR domain protein